MSQIKAGCISKVPGKRSVRRQIFVNDASPLSHLDGRKNWQTGLPKLAPKALETARSPNI